jgi:cell division septation protein DedD
VSQGRTLSRDFKHVKRQTPGAQAFSGWVGLLVGLAIGLAVALGVYLRYGNLPPAEPRPATEQTPASDAAATATPTPPTDPARDYTFYDMLPQQEVEVPKAAATRPSPSSQVLPAGDVVLQAGSFKQPGEADKLIAKLAQYGIDAKIQHFTLDDETWYRVRIGPIATVQELQTIQAKLAEAEIEARPVTPVVDAPPP